MARYPSRAIGFTGNHEDFERWRWLQQLVRRGLDDPKDHQDPEDLNEDPKIREEEERRLTIKAYKALLAIGQGAA